MTNLSKYKRSNLNILDKNVTKSLDKNIDKSHDKGLNQDNVKNVSGNKTTPANKSKIKKYTEKLTINLTKSEFDKLNKMSDETGATKSNLIRIALNKSGFFS